MQYMNVEQNNDLEALISFLGIKIEKKKGKKSGGEEIVSVPARLLKLPSRKSFYFSGANIFNSLPLKTRQTSSRVLFRQSLNELFL